MIKLVIDDLKKAKQFTSVFQLLVNISHEINIHFREDVFFFQGMDSAQICIYEIKIKNDWFSEYDVNEQKTIGVNMRLVSKVLNCRSINQKLSIVYNDDTPDVLEFQFENGGKDETNKYLTIPLYDFEVGLLDLEIDEYQADIKMNSSQLHCLVEQMASFGDGIKFECNEEYLQLEGGDNSSGTIRVPINIEELESYMIEEGGHLKMSFSTKYIKNITVFSKVFKHVSVHLDKQKPMNFYYSFDEENENSSEGDINYLKLYLAPKMSDEEEE